jgi:hypothetical protein
MTTFGGKKWLENEMTQKQNKRGARPSACAAANLLPALLPRCCLPCCCTIIESNKVKQGNPYIRGRISTVDLLVPTSFIQLVFKLKKIIFLTKQATLMRSSTVLILPFSKCSLLKPWHVNLTNIASWSSKVAKHSTRHPKNEGSSPATTAGTGREKMVKYSGTQ